jgi:malate dehydrogenase (oxaloacetate-decarboxylating)(NADP+)
MNGLMLPGRQVFLVDTHINYDPTAEQLAEITTMAAEEMMRFGLKPKAALLSHSNFRLQQPAQRRSRCGAPWRCCAKTPWLEVDGEMHGDIALDPITAKTSCPTAPWPAKPTCWCCPTLTRPTSPTTCSRRPPAATLPSARCCLGAAKPVHILTASDHGAPYRQHDGPDRRRRQRHPLIRSRGGLSPDELGQTSSKG